MGESRGAVEQGLIINMSFVGSIEEFNLFLFSRSDRRSVKLSYGTLITRKLGRNVCNAVV